MSDEALIASLNGHQNVKKYSFLDRGSDERQYCSPGIDLPVSTFCKTKFGEFPEYHTSLDNFNLVTAKGLQESFNVMKSIIDSFELGLFPKVEVLGEPQLGKRGLYPNISNWHADTDTPHPASFRRSVYFNRMNILAYCDANHSIFKIANLLELNLIDLMSELKILKENKLISFIDNFDKN